MSEHEPNYELVRARLRRVRQEEGLSLREVAERIEISPSTLSRIETGTGTPDLPTIDKLVEWLDIDRDAVFGVRTKRMKDQSTPASVEVLLRADKNLSPNTAKTLAKIFRTAYQELSRD